MSGTFGIALSGDRELLALLAPRCEGCGRPIVRGNATEYGGGLFHARHVPREDVRDREEPVEVEDTTEDYADTASRMQGDL